MPSINDAFTANTAALNALVGTVTSMINNLAPDAQKIRGKTINLAAETVSVPSVLVYNELTGIWDCVPNDSFAARLDLNIPDQFTDLNDVPNNLANLNNNILKINNGTITASVLSSKDLSDMPGIAPNMIAVGNNNVSYDARPYGGFHTILEATTPTYTAKPGESIWIDTTAGTVACLLPPNPPRRGDTVQVKGNNLTTNNAFVRRNGQLLESGTSDVTLNAANQDICLVWFGGSIGWRASTISSAAAITPSPSPSPTPGAFNYVVVDNFYGLTTPKLMKLDTSTARLFYTSGQNVITLQISNKNQLATYNSAIDPFDMSTNQAGDIFYVTSHRITALQDRIYAKGQGTIESYLDTYNASTGGFISRLVLYSGSWRATAVGSLPGSSQTDLSNLQMQRNLCPAVDGTNGIIFIPKDSYQLTDYQPYAESGVAWTVGKASPTIVAVNSAGSTILSTTSISGLSGGVDALGRIAVSVSNNRYYLPVTTQNKIYVFGYSSTNGSGTKIAEYVTSGSPVMCLFSVTHNRLIVLCSSGVVNIFDTTSGSPTATVVQIFTAINDGVIVNDTVFVTCRGTNNVVAVRFTGTPVVVATIPVGTYPNSIDADATRVYVSNQNAGSLSVIG